MQKPLFTYICVCDAIIGAPDIHYFASVGSARIGISLAYTITQTLKILLEQGLGSCKVQRIPPGETSATHFVTNLTGERFLPAQDRESRVSLLGSGQVELFLSFDSIRCNCPLPVNEQEPTSSPPSFLPLPSARCRAQPERCRHSKLRNALQQFAVR